MRGTSLNKLRILRKKHRITLADLAAKLHLSKAYLSMIENGLRALDYFLAVKIAAIFGLKPDQLFYLDFQS